MRQSRRLALFLAAQLAGLLPVAAYAQQSPPMGGASADDDDDVDDTQAPPGAAPTATPPPAANTSSPDAPQTATAPESDDDRRLRLLPRYSSLDGSIGLLHTSSAMTGAAGSFRVGLMTEFFGGGGFLRPPGLSGTAAVGGVDSSSHIGSTLTVSYSPLDFLEVYMGVRAYANSDNRETPTLFQVLGDTDIGVKGAFRVARGFYLGADAAAYLLNTSGDIGLMWNSTSFHLRALSTLDLQELTHNIPVRLHFNLEYYFDNSAALVAGTEALRQQAQPGYSSALCATNPTDPACHLEISRVERYALGINRVDQLTVSIGADVDVPIIRHVLELTPFAEWHVGVPVNRQGYQCYDPGATGAHPGGAADDDLCLANTGFASIPSQLTLGTRILPPVRGLSVTAAVDIATSGSSDFVRELAPIPPWMFYLGAGFAYDVHPVERRIEVPGPERVVPHDVDRTPPGGHILGHARDAEAHTPVANAIATFVGHPDLPIVASAADGIFRTGHLSPGDYRIHVVAPDYNPGDCTVTVLAAPTAPSSPDGTSPAGAPAAPAPSPTPPASTETEAVVNCDLHAIPSHGGIAGRVTSSVGGGGVSGANVVLQPAPGLSVPSGQSGPAPQHASTDAEGRFAFHDLFAGPYTLSVEASAQHMASMPRPVNVEAHTDVRADITVTRRPAHPSVTIRGNLLALARQIHFETNSAAILPDSTTLVEEIADVLNRHPEFSQVEIQGHTDNQGTPAGNEALSQSRADAVRTALMHLGISGDRLLAHGFGQSHPIRPNMTVAGRAANRRVEFHLTRSGTSPVAGAAHPAGVHPLAPRPSAHPALAHPHPAGHTPAR